MSTQIQLRRGTTVDNSTFTGASGELIADTTKNILVLHDGITAGGHPFDLPAHLDTTMPHKFVDGITTYRWGLKVVNGVVTMQYEEVV